MLASTHFASGLGTAQCAKPLAVKQRQHCNPNAILYSYSNCVGDTEGDDDHANCHADQFNRNTSTDQYRRLA